MMYISLEMVAATLESIQHHTACGGWNVFDYTLRAIC
jgi:hypothetical protein